MPPSDANEDLWSFYPDEDVIGFVGGEVNKEPKSGIQDETGVVE